MTCPAVFLAWTRSTTTCSSNKWTEIRKTKSRSGLIQARHHRSQYLRLSRKNTKHIQNAKKTLAANWRFFSNSTLGSVDYARRLYSPGRSPRLHGSRARAEIHLGRPPRCIARRYPSPQSPRLAWEEAAGNKRKKEKWRSDERKENSRMPTAHDVFVE